jgi:hypothetical protein
LICPDRAHNEARGNLVMNSGKTDDKLVNELVESGSDIAGSAVGAALGFVAGGPVGAAAGAATGSGLSHVIKHVGSDLKRRFLGPREEVRVGAALAFAGSTINHLLEKGATPRQDGFFEPSPDGNRAPGEELLEGVLLKARDAYEEKKVKYLGMLYAQIAFHPEIGQSHANHLVSLADNLTYRQLVVLAVASDDSNRHRLLQSGYRGNEAAAKSLGLDGTALVTEVYDLYQRGLLGSTDNEAWISVVDVFPGGMTPQGSGHVLIQMMCLTNIPPEDRAEIYRLLGVSSDTPPK